MAYNLGELISLNFDVQADDVDIEPTGFVITVTKPDGTVDTLTDVTNPTAGVYEANYKPSMAGHHTWLAVASGSITAVQTGVFDVFDTNPQGQPLTGIAAPWIDAAAIARRPEVQAYVAQTEADATLPKLEPWMLNAAARFASEILYSLSGRQFSGLARTYCRPVARPEGWDARSWGAGTFSSYWDSWGGGFSMGYGAASAPALGYHLGAHYPAEVALNYPVQYIESIKIDGTTIPPDEYRVDDYRLLVRTKPTAGATPTARSGWPHWQALWLPDTEEQTFSVTYWYGAAPPQAGVTAAEVFATELALDMVGADNRLPARITTITRQGETAAVTDSLESLQQGWTGIPICDYFIFANNPHRLARRGSVWSPDTGRVRTPTSGT